MVELRTRKREMRGEGTNHNETLGMKRISCASQFTIPDTAGTSPDPACNHTTTRSCQLYQTCRTPDPSYLVVSSTSFSSLSPISLFLIHNSTIIAEHKVKSSLCISPCHYHELTLSTSIHQVQASTEYKHTPSTCIHQVQHPPTIVCLPFIPMIMSRPLNIASAWGVPP